MTAPTAPAPASRWEGESAAAARVWLPALAALVLQLGALLIDDRGRALRALLGGRIGPREDELLLAVLLAVAGPALLLLARRAPGPVVAAIAGITALDLLLADGEDRLPVVALALAVCAAIVRGARAWAWASVIGGLLVTLLLSPLADEEWEVRQIVVVTVGLLIAIGLGEALRGRRERRVEVAREVSGRRETAVRAERERIARELHDVLAHSLSQISVQAGVGLHLAQSGREDALAVATDALRAIRASSGDALADVRQVIGALRSDDDAPLAPEPGLDRLEALVQTARDAGLEATLRIGPLGEVPRPVQAAAYRIVQESLTNTVRHAEAARVDVALARQAGALVIEVSDDGRGAPDPAMPGGLGITGMSERAALLGGRLDAGPRAVGGFAVVARIPVASAEPEASPPSAGTPAASAPTLPPPPPPVGGLG